MKSTLRWHEYKLDECENVWCWWWWWFFFVFIFSCIHRFSACEHNVWFMILAYEINYVIYDFICAACVSVLCGWQKRHELNIKKEEEKKILNNKEKTNKQGRREDERKKSSLWIRMKSISASGNRQHNNLFFCSISGFSSRLSYHQIDFILC